MSSKIKFRTGQRPTEIGRWEYTGISCDFGPGASQPKGPAGKTPGNARREGWGGVPGKKPKPQFPLGRASATYSEKLPVF